MSTRNPKLLSNGAEDFGRYMEVRGYLSQGTKRGVEWLESQNTVLEEVDQLVELMAVEKETMSREITKLREEHTELLERDTILGSENTKLKLENINKQSMLAIQEEQGAKVTGALKDVMELTKRQLDETRYEVDCLTNNLSRTREKSKSLAMENLELKERSRKFKCDCSDLSTTLEILRSENLKLTSSLSCAREQCRKLQVDTSFLKSRENELEERLKIGEDMILAMRGRANSSRKVEEQLKSKCVSLERALELANLRPAPCRIPNPEKTRVELELIRECKKKEEALIDYSNQLSASQVEQKKQRLQKSKMERTVTTERRKNMRLTRELESMQKERDTEERGLRESVEETKELRRKLRKSMTDLRVAKKKELQFNVGKQEVEMSMYHIEDELRRSKDEICDLRCELEVKEGHWWDEKQRMERGKLEIVKTHSKEIDRLREQLQAKCCLGDTCVAGDRDRDDMLEDAKDDYRRLKEASTKRCTELAKEVWRLKTLVSEIEDGEHSHHHHHHAHTLNHPKPPCMETGEKCPRVCIETN